MRMYYLHKIIKFTKESKHRISGRITYQTESGLWFHYIQLLEFTDEEMKVKIGKGTTLGYMPSS